ncbi:MAG: signal peptidase [Acidimicrobiaceae bacterium]|nr:signal peptidase [Acidimicrobiaceae bacterium]
MSDPVARFPPGPPVTPRTGPATLGRSEGASGADNHGAGPSALDAIDPLGSTGPTDPTGPTRPTGHARKGGSARAIAEWVVILVAALTVAIVVKTFLIQAFYIPSGSMEPTLKPGDRVLVNKLSYDLHSIHRGDIVVFKRPPSEADDPTIKDLIKRVIGLPGDQIEGRDGLVYINGQLLKEPYLPAGTVTTSLPLMTVPAGQYFVMGDNRGNSKDSRFIGPIAGHLIVGRAFVRVWPLSGLGLL